MTEPEANVNGEEVKRLQARLAQLTAEAVGLEQQNFVYEQILDSVRDLIFIKDRDSRIVYYNKAMCDLWGTTKQSMLGQRELPSAYNAQYLADDAYVFETGNTLVIDELPWSRDGVIRVYDMIKTPVFDAQGNVAQLVGVGRDVTERVLVEENRKQAQQALDNAERLFGQMAESARDVFWMGTPDWKQIIYVNSAYETVWGRPKEEVLSNARSFLDAVLEVDRPGVMRQMGAIANGEANLVSHEFRIVRDGGIRWLWARVFPIHDEDGNVWRIGGITHDITERKEVERRINAFNSMVSHELRTPLTSIRAALGLVEGGQTEPVGETTAELVRIGSSECQRMILLINDLLDIKKIEADNLQLTMLMLSPQSVVEAAVKDSVSAASDACVHVSVKLETEEQFAGDQARVVQALGNLIANGIKFSPPDGEVVVKVSSVGDSRIRFAVTDRGAGIAEGDQATLFTAFQQGDVGDNRTKGGTGLGLAIAKAIIDRHGGKIGVDSSDADETTFWFELPLQAPAEFYRQWRQDN